MGMALALAVASVTLGVSAGAAGADQTQATSIAGATAQATKLEAEITANSKRADILDERYNQAQSAVAAAQKQIAATQAQIAATEAKVARLHTELAGRAALLYEGAGNSDPVGFDAQSVQQLGSMTKYGEAAGEEDERVLSLLEITDSQLNSQRDDLQGQLGAAQDKQHAAKNARDQVARANAKLQHLLDTTRDDIKVLANQMAAQAAAAAAVAERDWLLHQAKKQAGAGAGDATGGGTGAPGAGAPGPAIDLPPPSAGALKAVAYAQAQLGKPYVYAGVGPKSYDCSGLTMMAWAQAGVAMEHGSQSQYDSFPHVPIDQLQPGDLVFFGDTGPTNHHVGIVIGPGIMIDAPHTGAFVEIVSYFRSDLVPLGARP